MDDPVLEKGFAAVAQMVDHLQGIFHRMDTENRGHVLDGDTMEKLLGWKRELGRGLQVIEKMESLIRTYTDRLVAGRDFNVSGL